MRWFAALLTLLALGIPSVGYSQLMSVAPGGSVPADDILAPGPGPIFANGGTWNVDAFSQAYFVPPVLASFASGEFSVAPGATGVGGTGVAMEAGMAGDDAPADIFTTSAMGGNVVLFDGNGTSASPLGLAEPFVPAGDNVDGWDSGVIAAGAPIYWSVDVASTGLAPYIGLGATASDIFVAPAGAGFAAAPAIYLTGAALGLTPGDELDALVVFEDGVPGATAGDFIAFSLAAGSPSLGVGPYAGFLPGDILGFSVGGGPAPLFLAGAAIGLAPGDDLNALGVTPIPEPSTIALLSLVGVGAVATGWRKRRRAAA